MLYTNTCTFQSWVKFFEPADKQVNNKIQIFQIRKGLLASIYSITEILLNHKHIFSCILEIYQDCFQDF